jgi:hypothetical protein
MDKIIWVLATGNPFDGIMLYGPFPSREDATNAGEMKMGGGDWWITTLESIDDAP